MPARSSSSSKSLVIFASLIFPKCLLRGHEGVGERRVLSFNRKRGQKVARLPIPSLG